MRCKSDKIIIVFCGPESSAKSTVSKQAAHHFGAEWVAEHARSYVEQLNRPYTYEDVIAIAEKQIAVYHRLLISNRKIIIFDTFLIITKIWLQEVYAKVPGRLSDELERMSVDLYLLCKPDIPWVSDGIRENETRRQELYSCYKNEIEKYGFPYQIVSGEGNVRLNQAISHINTIIKQRNYDCQSFANR